MKKIFITAIFFLLAFAGLSANYNVILGKNVKLSEKEVAANNAEIENRVKNVFDISLYSPEEVKSIIKREYSLWDAGSDEETDIFISSIKSVFSSTKYEIKEINYTDARSAKIILTVSIPNLDELSDDAKQAEIEKKVEKKFRDKTGITYNTLKKDSALKKKYESLLLALYMETSAEEIKNIKTYNKEESVYILKKEGNIWNFENNTVNFFGR
jgi:hypothetical protein